VLLLLLVYPSHSGIASFENNAPQDITPDNFLIESTIDVAGLKTSLSSNAVITLQLWFTHPSNEEIAIFLYGPESYVLISNRRGGRNANVFNGTLFTDSAPDSVVAYSYSNNTVDTLRPEQPLSSFIDKNPNGQWKLWMYGEYKGNGSLNKFTLNIQGKITNNQ